MKSNIVPALRNFASLRNQCAQQNLIFKVLLQFYWRILIETVRKAGSWQGINNLAKPSEIQSFIKLYFNNLDVQFEK